MNRPIPHAIYRLGAVARLLADVLARARGGLDQHQPDNSIVFTETVELAPTLISYKNLTITVGDGGQNALPRRRADSPLWRSTACPRPMAATPG